MKSIRIGNGAGFWGDNLDAPRRIAESGRLDYLTLEYLAELTMSILAHLRSKNPDAGFVTDFPLVLESLVPALKSQPGLKIVANAGGMNPQACARQAAKVLCQAGMPDVAVAAVEGDDLLPRLDELMEAGEPFSHFDTGAALGDLRGKLVSANAYLGSEGIVQALSLGARIVVTGRVADASLTVGPALYELARPENSLHILQSATVAGHLIECGAQATGGMFSAWNEAIPLREIGYPIAELSDDGGCVITKPEGTGGIVNVATIAEQLVYEIGDPAHYLTPDLDADFSKVMLAKVGPDRVQVSNAGGLQAPARLKVSMAYHDGWTVTGMITVCGPRAAEVARYSGRLILDRVREAGFELSRSQVEVLGAGDSLPGMKIRGHDQSGWDVVLRVTAFDPRREAVDRLAREFAPLVTSGPPGVTGYLGGRPEPRRVLAYWPSTIARELAPHQVSTRTAKEWTA